jgi:hypothetical protein
MPGEVEGFFDRSSISICQACDEDDHDTCIGACNCGHDQHYTAEERVDFDDEDLFASETNCDNCANGGAGNSDSNHDERDDAVFSPMAGQQVDTTIETRGAIAPEDIPDEVADRKLNYLSKNTAHISGAHVLVPNPMKDLAGDDANIATNTTNYPRVKVRDFTGTGVAMHEQESPGVECEHTVVVALAFKSYGNQLNVKHAIEELHRWIKVEKPQADVEVVAYAYTDHGGIVTKNAGDIIALLEQADG